eukprot:gene9396-9559_t
MDTSLQLLASGSTAGSRAGCTADLAVELLLLSVQVTGGHAYPPIGVSQLAEGQRLRGLNGHHCQVAIGEAVSSSIAHYLAAQEAAGGVSCNVITVPEECGTADALRLVAKHITAETLVVYSGDILTDLPVKALLATHQGVDYLGIDVSRQLLLFAASSPEQLRDVKLPMAAIQQAGSLELRTDLVDEHLYVLSRAALTLLCAQPSLSSLKLDFIPWLARHQLKHPPPGGKPDRHMPGDGYMLLSHADAAASSSRAGRIGVYQVPAGRYCARVNTVQAYGDVNREVDVWQ